MSAGPHPADIAETLPQWLVSRALILAVATAVAMWGIC